MKPDNLLKRGFTLIELLIVVSILSILAAIAIPNYLQAQTRAKISRACSDMRTITTAIETYRIDQGGYPYLYLYRWEYDDNGQPPIFEYGTLEQNIYELEVLTTPVAYMTSIPKDPFGHQGIETQVPYDYTSFKAFAKANFQMGDSIWNARWTLKCRGPDRVFSSMLDYDPTNGIVSNGDINRYGNGLISGDN